LTKPAKNLEFDPDAFEDLAWWRGTEKILTTEAQRTQTKAL
jgi:hypothetical protein